MTDNRFHVVITDYITDPAGVEQSILGDLAHVTAVEAQCESDLAGRIEQADAVMVYHYIRLTEPTINRLQNCKVMVRCGVGYDNVDVEAARRRGIPVANVPDYGTEEVADSAIGLMLAMTRGIMLLDRRMRSARGAWTPTEAGPVRRLRGRVFGIVGLGRIGKGTALRAKALGMDVIFHDPYVPDGTDKSLGVRRVESLDELLECAHVLSLHCPHTSETHQLINPKTLARLNPGSFLVNTARSVCRTGRGPRVVDQRTPGRRRVGRLAPGTAGCRRTPDCRLARFRSRGQRSLDCAATCRLLLGRGPARHAHQGLPEYPTSVGRALPPQRG